MKRSLLQSLLQAKTAKTPAALVTELDSGQQALLIGEAWEGELDLSPAQQQAVQDALVADRSGVLPGEELFVQVHLPPLRLIVVGAVHISQALVPMAQLCGYDTVVVDPRRAWATEERFPGVTLLRDWPDDALETLGLDRRTSVVTLTHDPKLDDPALLAALDSEVFYIGALGSKRTHAKREERLSAAGIDAKAFARINGPAGLDIGAKSPAEIAVSVMAEMTEALRKGPPLRATSLDPALAKADLQKTKVSSTAG